MRENMFETVIQSLLHSFGGGASRLDGGHEVKKASNLKILGYYGTRTVISIFRILGNFNVSDGTATFPLAHRRGATCHCENGVCPTSQSQNSCNINGITTQTTFARNDSYNEITTSNASHSPRNAKFSSLFTLHSSLFT